ncbi:MAG: hypothetical protein ASUL_03324 [Candidatus Aramenus sulfurataquae]|jgi:D-aminoacyl-tRNA deacylase|uniref:D-tyrosyl-tRNA(Tyr) deacylase n=2 Tax=Candidatus Aramenus sulfurataquae TaxID=1326980 RepID=W7KXS2_9CREN|nr:MAG: hypothetical protein ASUL_03324 [Candidatus Aramenus sulfurataquae]MCL7343707.1 D-aminoacyl-tRNA deacylase [Candidatus Aramenus sulfurataquae]
MNIKVIVSEKDPVGQTAKKLFGFDSVEEDVTDFTYDKADAIVILSRHESSAGIPSLTVHFPGNPSDKAMGGKPKTLGVAFPRLLTSIYRELLKIDVPIDKVIEATHHGPTLDKPVVFAEIGSDVSYWTNQELVRKLAEAVLRGVENYENVTCDKVVLGLGGPHYSKLFSNLAKSSCISHIISKHYLTEIDSNIILQAIEKSIDKVDTIVFDSINRDLRQKILSYIGTYNISVEFR